MLWWQPVVVIVGVLVYPFRTPAVIDKNIFTLCHMHTYVHVFVVFILELLHIKELRGGKWERWAHPAEIPLLTMVLKTKGFHVLIKNTLFKMWKGWKLKKCIKLRAVKCLNLKFGQICLRSCGVIPLAPSSDRLWSWISITLLLLWAWDWNHQSWSALVVVIVNDSVLLME